MRLEAASINVSVCRGSEQNKKSPSYGLADFGHGTRDDKCALAIIQSALIILTFTDRQSEDLPAVMPPSRRPIAAIKCWLRGFFFSHFIY